MATTIIALFDDEQQARHVESEIEQRGFDTSDIDAVTWRALSEGVDPWGIGRRRGAGENASARLVEELEARGVPSEDARDFAEAVRRGGNLVVTEVDDDRQADQVSRIMDQRGAVDLGERRAQWREQGYTGFSEDADLYTVEDIERDVEHGDVRVHKSDH